MKAMVWTIFGIALVGYGLACAWLYLKQTELFVFSRLKRSIIPFEVEVFENQGEAN